MSRRPLTLIALSLVALSLSACADTTAPTAASGTRQIQPAVGPNHDPIPDDCRGGYHLSSGKAC